MNNEILQLSRDSIYLQSVALKSIITTRKAALHCSFYYGCHLHMLCLRCSLVVFCLLHFVMFLTLFVVYSFPTVSFEILEVEIVEAYTGQEESSFCGKCDEQNSLRFYCSNCNCLLREECAIVHKKWKDFRGHKLKEIGQL